MDSETPVLKWTAAAIGVIVLCFCIGYFVLGRGPSGGESGNTVAIATPLDGANAPPVPVVSASAAAGPAMIVDEKTDAIEAKQKAEDAAKKKAEEAAKKKEDAAAALKAQEDAAAAAAASNATPAPADAGNTGDNAPASPPPAVVDADNGATTPAATPKPTTDTATPSDTIYRVRVGSYASRDAAKAMATELTGRGYAAMVVNGGGGAFRLQVGAYKDKKTADGIQQELKSNGYDATVSN